MNEKLYPNNEILYHYTNEKTALLYILNTKELRFGALNSTNDPKEYFGFTPKVTIDYGFSSFSFENHRTIKKEDIIFTDKNIEFDRLEDQFGIVCFTQDKENINNTFDLGYAKPRMWSQYGDNHHGACIMLDKEIFEKEFNNIKRKKKSRKVTYNLNQKNSLVEIKLTHNDITNNRYNKIYRSVFDKNISKILFNKSIDWKEENEHRYLVEFENESEYFINIKKSLKGIILSHRCNKKMEEYLVNRSINENFDLFILNWYNGIPNLRNAKRINQIISTKEEFKSLEKQLEKMITKNKYINDINKYYENNKEFINKIRNKISFSDLKNEYYKIVYNNYPNQYIDQIQDKIRKSMNILDDYEKEINL